MIAGVKKIIRSNYFKKSKNLLGPIILVYVLLKIDLNQLKNVLVELDMIFFFALFLFFPMMVVKTYRWLLILRDFKIDIRFYDLYNLNLKGVLYGSITPGRIGEITKGYLLGKRNYPISTSIVSAVFDRLVDIFYLVWFAILGFIFFYKELNMNIFILLGITVSVIAVLFMFVNKKIRSSLFQIISKKLKDEDGAIANYFKNINKSKMISLSFLSIFAWIIYFYEIYFFSIAISIQIDFLYLVAAISVSTVISILPISILGLGTRDATLILLFSIQNISSEQTLALSFLILLMFIFNIFSCYLFSMMVGFKSPQKIISTS